MAVERISSGIPGLDDLIEGGLEKESIVLMVGSPGTGKTTLALQFLYNGAVQFKEPGVFITFAESRQSLFEHASPFGWKLEELEQKNLLRVLQFKPHQVGRVLSEGGGAIRDEIKALNAKRLALDSVSAYMLLFKEEYQKRENVVKFFDLLKEWHLTALIISEMPAVLSQTQEASIAFLSDGIIALYYSRKPGSEERMHSIEVLKMRGTRHSAKPFPIIFGKNGLKVDVK